MGDTEKSKSGDARRGARRRPCGGATEACLLQCGGDVRACPARSSQARASGWVVCESWKRCSGCICMHGGNRAVKRQVEGGWEGEARKGKQSTAPPYHCIQPVKAVPRKHLNCSLPPHFATVDGNDGRARSATRRPPTDNQCACYKRGNRFID